MTPDPVKAAARSAAVAIFDELDNEEVRDPAEWCGSTDLAASIIERHYRELLAGQGASGPQWACADCGNVNLTAFHGGKTGGRPDDPQEYWFACDQCGSEDVCESPSEALATATNKLDSERAAAAARIADLEKEISILKGGK